MATATDWVETADVCAALRVDVSTLYRIRQRSSLREGFHFVRKNPKVVLTGTGF